MSKPMSLAQVMKQAVGIDPQTALGAAVRELKTRDHSIADGIPTIGSQYEISRADVDAEPIELTKPKK